MGVPVRLEVDGELPDGSVIVAAVLVVELLDRDGTSMLSCRHSPGMAPWTAAGMALAGADRWREETKAGWRPPDDD